MVNNVEVLTVNIHIQSSYMNSFHSHKESKFLTQPVVFFLLEFLKFKKLRKFKI